jgi:uncharacterized protein (DUF58 family)
VESVNRDFRSVIETNAENLFDAAFLGQLESLSLLARRIVSGQMRAERRSTRFGSSIEFAEYRPFVSGDDWRHIDWNAFARWRQLVLKLFVEEEDLHVHLLLDCTGSMNWGAPVKFDYARQIVAGLAYITLANLDRAAVVPFGNARYDLWRPSRGRHRFLQLLRYLACCPVAPQTSPPQRLEDAARRWIATQPRRGMVIWVSDLWGADLEDALHTLDRLRYSRHDLAVIQVMDPAEADAGERGEYELVDEETGALRKVIVDHRTRAEYREKFEAYQAGIKDYCRRNQIALIQTDTRLDVPALLMQSLLQGGFVK